MGFDGWGQAVLLPGMRLLRRLALLSAGCAVVAVAQEPDPAAPHDPQIDKITTEISPANIEATVRKLVSFKTRHTLSTATSPDTGIGAARNWIKGELERYSRESGGRLAVEFDAFHQPPTPPRLPQGADIVNVVATLPGMQPGSAGRIYLVCAHYDSRPLAIMNTDESAPGANDNGSGTSAVMELARVMAHYPFDATIKFILFAAEEQELDGSAHWARLARQQEWNIAGVLNNDIVGNTLHEDGTRDRSHVRLYAVGVTPPVPPAKELPADVLAQIRAGGEADFPTRQLARLIQSVGARYVPQLPAKIIYRRDRYLRDGDHGSFLDQGFAAVRFTDPYEVYAREHQAGDTPDLMDFAYAADVARVNAAALAELALAPAVPHGVELETVKLENDTTMRWEPNAEPDLAGYRIVWRDTTASQWEHALDVPKDVTRYTVKGVSKDNVIFGLQAVDAGGHTSPAVYPKPRRVP